MQLFTLTGCINFNSGENEEESTKGKVQQMSYFNYFDTVSYIYSYKYDTKEEFLANCEIASNVLNEYHQLFDIYYEYEGVTNLCTINKNAGGEPLEVDQKLIDFLLYVKEVTTLTNGKMNPMMGSVLKLWHNARETSLADSSLAYIPTMEELEEANKYTSIDLLEINEENKTVRITDANASIDVGAIGKGYATEKAANALEEKGVTSYVLNIGGNIRTIGTKANGDGWITGIKDPFDSDNSYAMYIKISDTSVVTSGVYERYFTVNNIKYHHIIDPVTLMPANNFVSLTVITKNSGLGDALSTALFCMSYEEGLEIVNKLDGVEVVWIFSNGEIKCTDNVPKYEAN